jgi:hypothetical protein
MTKKEVGKVTALYERQLLNQVVKWETAVALILTSNQKAA